MSAVVARVALAAIGKPVVALFAAPLVLGACSPGAPMGWDGLAHQARLAKANREGGKPMADGARDREVVSADAGNEIAADAADRAIERARSKKLALRGERGDALAKLREEAVAAYVRVHERWPKSGATASEAAFRAGELLRAGGSPDRALEQFRAAISVANPGEFADRALYEIGHVQRREGRSKQALDAFEELVASGPTDPHLRDMASVWYARVLSESGQPEHAERVLRRLTKTASDATDRIRAFDELIRLLVDRGELEGAVGWLGECKQSVRNEANELTTEGQRVRNALERMRGLIALQAAIKARMRTPGYDPLR